MTGRASRLEAPSRYVLEAPRLLRRLPPLAALSSCLLAASPAGAQGGWPQVFDPNVVLNLHLQMTGADWNTVQNDTSFSVEVPAQFWADGEAPILVSVRRKSDKALTAAAGFKKVSLRVDINEYVLGQDWRELKKLSLENGGDSSPVSEGFAWAIHRLASGVLGYGYDAARSAWVRVFINGVDTGVYLSAEMRDKRLLENRNLWVDGQTWLYEVEDVSGGEILHEGGPQPSPTLEALCYTPFQAVPTCPRPDLSAALPAYVHVRGLLTLMAGDAFTVNGDATFTNAKNFYFADFLTGPKRMYFTWDLDGAKFGGNSATSSIYNPRRTSRYAVLLDDPELRAQYTSIVNDLVCGPWSAASLTAFLDGIEPALAPALDADPNGGGDAAGQLDALRSWSAARVANVTSQLEGFQPCPTVQLRLNEVMASNVASLEDPAEPGEFPDWFEIQNPAAVSVDVGGVYLSDDPLVPTKFQIPAGVVVPASGHLVFYADEDPEQGPLHTNFKLAGSGESLRITDRDGVRQIDSLVFGPQVADVSFGRYPDGGGPWNFAPTATPGLPNAPHNPPPVIAHTGRDQAVPAAPYPVRVTSQVSDDGGLASVVLRYDAGAGAIAVPMLDDGLSGDGAAGDGVFGASIPAFPDDTIVRYWVTATDALGGASQDPVPAPSVTFTYVVGYRPPPLALNEFLADNDAVIEDPEEPLAFEDWIEIYNAGAAPVSLDGMYLTDDLFDPKKFALPPGLVVPAGGFLLLWADSEPFQGSRHLGFQLAAAGEQIGLTDSDARGNVPIDSLGFGPQLPNAGEGRCPDGYDEIQPLASPTPGAANQGAASCPGGAIVVFAGTAQGGEVRIAISGRLVVVTTIAGWSAEEVALAVADAIDADPILASAGIGGAALGPQVATPGTLDSLEVTDPGLGGDPPVGVPTLGVPARLALALLLFGAGRRGLRPGGAAHGADSSDRGRP
jgi:hypothetical protein